MSSRRTKLIEQVLSSGPGDQSAQSLETVIKLILGDMGEFYYKFHQSDGPGVIVFQPKSKDASMFFMPVAALKDWRDDYKEGEQEIQKIIDAVIKIDPLKNSAYLILDDQGFRFCIIDYDQTKEETVIPCLE
jgi:hypothetical protein